MLETERTRLVPMTRNEAELVVRWRNNELVREYLCDPSYLTIDGHLQWLADRRDRIDFIIEKKLDLKLIGTINLSSIDQRNQKAEYGILIGETQEWGNGYSQEVSRAVLDYGFQELNLNRIYLRVLAANQGALKLYRKLGFIEEGRLRQDSFRHGVFQDVVMMALLKKDFEVAR